MRARLATGSFLLHLYLKMIAPQPRRLLLIAIASAGLTLLPGCQRNGSGGMLGQHSGSGDPAGKQAKPQPGGGGDQSGAMEPASSVDGQPSVDSDNGDAAAVAHRSVAQPGAPQGTVQGAPPPAKNASPADRSSRSTSRPQQP